MKKISILTLLLCSSATVWTMEYPQTPIQEDDAAAICMEIREMIHRMQEMEQKLQRMQDNNTSQANEQSSTSEPYKKKLRSYSHVKKSTK